LKVDVKKFRNCEFKPYLSNEIRAFGNKLINILRQLKSKEFMRTISLEFHSPYLGG